jgi:HEAT repeat protein
LSYRSTEVDFALRLAADLKNAGVNLWMDRLDINPGDDWRISLQNAVDNCAAVISVLSSAYATSKYCQRELARADRLGRPIFPILLGTISETEWPLEIEREQYIDFSGWQEEALYQAKLQLLVDNLKERFADQISVVPSPEMRYLTNLAAHIETQKGLTEYLEFSTDADKLLNRDALRPEPRSIKFSTGHTSFALLQQQPINLYQRQQFREVDDILELYPRIVLIGEAGSGKTVTLRRLVLEAIYDWQAAPGTKPLPLLLNLVAWDETVSFEDFIRSNWPLDTDPIKLMMRGEIALYLDGLDGLGGSRARKLEELREWLASEHAPKQVIITCQTSAFEPQYDLGLPLVEIESLDRRSIDHFVNNYLSDKLSQIFLSRILPRGNWEDRHKQYLYQLARNPFLLSALILVHKSSSYGELPENLGRLLDLLVAEMWQRAHAKHPDQTATFEGVEVALTDLAQFMIESDAGIYLPLDRAVEIVGEENVIEAARKAGLIEICGSNVRFAQHMLQHYFAGRSFYQGSLSARLSPPRLTASGEYAPGPWDQAIIIYAGLSHNPDEILLEIASANPFLALECIASGINASETLVEPLIGRLLYVANASEHDARVAIGSILGRIDTELALPVLLEAMRDGSWDVRLGALLALQQLDVPLLSGLTDVLQGFAHDVQDAAERAVRQLGSSALPTLLKLLQNDQPKIRRAAAWALGCVIDKAAVPGLVRALYDEDNRVCAEAVESLGKIKDEASIPWMLPMLRHANWRVRKAAARMLADSGKHAVNQLLQVLQDPVEDTRRVVIEAIREIDNDRVREALIQATYDPNVDVRASAIEALAGRKYQPVIDRLIECLQDSAITKSNRKRICDIAARVLADFNDPQAISALQYWEKDGTNVPMSTKSRILPLSAGTRSTQASASTAKDRLLRLVQDGDETPGMATIDDSFDEDGEVRRKAILSLKGNSTPIAMLRLMRALDDEEVAVRLAAVATLGTIHNNEAVNALIRAMQENHAPVASAAVDQLAALGSRAVPLLVPLLTAGDVNLRITVIDLLGRIGDSTVIPHLMPLLAVTDQAANGELVKDAAARTLRRMTAPQKAVHQPSSALTAATALSTQDQTNHQRRDILGELLNALRQAEWGDRENAAKALREYAKTLHGTRQPEVIQRLGAVINDTDWVVRWAAAEALAWIGAAEAVPLILNLLQDRYWMVRISAIRALLEMGDPTAVQPISYLLLDSHTTVREAAAEALGILGDPSGIPALTAALADQESLVRLAAATALGRIPDKTVIPVLLQALKDADCHVRWAAVQALGRNPDVQAVPALIGCLQDHDGPYYEDQKIDDLAAAALLRIGTDEAIRAARMWQSQHVRQS